MKEININKRYQIFKKNFTKKNYKIIAPFLFKIKLKSDEIKKLQNSALIFLNSAFKFKDFKNLENILKTIKRNNFKNISTSGLIVPKYYSSLEYNLFMREFYECINNLGVNVQKWYTSLPVRIKFGDFVPKNFSIQDSSTLHVDSPTGFSTNCFAIFYNIGGDIKNNYIKFWRLKKNIKKLPYSLLIGKPTNIKLEIAKKFIEPLNFKLKFGEILIADNIIYHQTIRNKKCGNRISIDNLCEPKFTYGKDEKSKYRKTDLVETSKLLNLGKRYIYHYPHDDDKFKKTYGLRSPAHKKEIKFL